MYTIKNMARDSRRAMLEVKLNRLRRKWWYRLSLYALLAVVAPYLLLKTMMLNYVEAWVSAVLVIGVSAFIGSTLKV